MPGGDEYTLNSGPIIPNKLKPLLKELIEKNRGKSLNEFLDKF